MKRATNELNAAGGDLKLTACAANDVKLAIARYGAFEDAGVVEQDDADLAVVEIAGRRGGDALGDEHVRRAQQRRDKSRVTSRYGGTSGTLRRRLGERQDMVKAGSASGAFLYLRGRASSRAS